jgi:hypothetical protein
MQERQREENEKETERIFEEFRQREQRLKDLEMKRQELSMQRDKAARARRNHMLALSMEREREDSQATTQKLEQISLKIERGDQLYRTNLEHKVRALHEKNQSLMERRVTVEERKKHWWDD